MPCLVKGKLYCHAAAWPVAIAPARQVIAPFEPVLVSNPMIFPGVPADSPLNGRPWPNVFEQIEVYIKDKTGDVSEKTLQVYKNVGDHLRQFEKYRKQPITFQSFDFDFYDKYFFHTTAVYIYRLEIFSAETIVVIRCAILMLYDGKATPPLPLLLRFSSTVTPSCPTLLPAALPLRCSRFAPALG